jgi:hypothetical protein
MNMMVVCFLFHNGKEGSENKQVKRLNFSACYSA